MSKPLAASREGFAGKLVVGILLFGFAGWTVISMFERFQAIWTQPDLNSDGKVSILDIPHATGLILFEVGHRYQAILARTKVGSFLEMRSEEPNMIWSIALAAFTYFLIVGFSVLLLDHGTDPK
jgi:hypothetical protein